jgi:hypothetical protein
VELLCKLFDREILLHFPHLLPVNREAKDTRQQPGLYKQRHGEMELFSLQKESEKVREGTAKGRGSSGGSESPGSDSSELSFETLSEAE